MPRSDPILAINPWRWSVAIFASRERTDDVLETIHAAIKAAAEPTIIDVLVNGNDALASGLADCLKLTPPNLSRAQVRVWKMPLADKANAWNQYLHDIWRPTQIAFFLDGHCRVNEGGFKALADGLAATPYALAGSAVPSVGRTAVKWRADLLSEGGMVGGFLAIRESTMETLRERGFRLPLGLYGFDGVLGAIFAFGLDPAVYRWELKERIHVNADATWVTAPKKWWRFGDIMDQIARKRRIALRVLVGRATRDFFEYQKRRPEELPRTIQCFILDWFRKLPLATQSLIRRNLQYRIILRDLENQRDWSAASTRPVRVLGLDMMPTHAQSGALANRSASLGGG